MDIEKISDTSLNTDKIPNMKQDSSSMLRKLRYRSSKVISDLQAEINKLKKEKNSLTVQLYQVQRRQKIKKSIEDTTEKKVDQVIKDIKMDKIENVRKNLLFSETVNRGVFEKYKSLPKMQKRTFAKDESRLKKYGILSKIIFSLRNKLSEQHLQERKTAKIKSNVQIFFQQDDNSQVVPGKIEYVKSGDETVHDVYDNDSLIHIDTPTIYNNIGDLIEASNLDTNIENSSKIKTLSNIPVNYQCLTDNHSSQGFSTVDQTEFIKFLQRPDLQDFETVIEKSKIKLDLSNDWGKTNNMTDKNFENDKENEDEIDDLKYYVDDWVVVEYKTNKNPQYFVGKIIEKFRNTLEYKIIFLRKAQGRSLKFGWPMISDDDIISQSCIFLRLEEPVESRRGQFVFKNLPELRFQ
ncbi:hypothetical protein ACJJTC_011394 [Scirpophaga incertulas]